MKILVSIISLYILFLFIIIGVLIMQIVKMLISEAYALFKKTTWLTVSIGILLLLCIVMLYLYFKHVSGSLSSNPSDWGAFGAYLGSITGLLAFSGVLYTVTQSNKSQKENSERDMFFKLLELHNKKLDSVVLKINENDYKGIGAFKEIVEVVDKHLVVYFLNKYVLDFFSNKNENEQEVVKYLNQNTELFKLYDNLCQIQLGKSLCDPLWSTRTKKEVDKECLTKLHELVKKEYTFQCSNNRMFNNEFVLFNDLVKCNLTVDGLLEPLSTIANELYKEYGYLLGHYFRNMYYVMSSINKFKDREKYTGIFRAQFSRYELVLMLFNALSSNGSNELIDLLIKFDVFKDLYPNDLSVFAMLKSKDTVSSALDNQEWMREISTKILEIRKNQIGE